MTSVESRLYEFVFRGNLAEEALDSVGRRIGGSLNSRQVRLRGCFLWISWMTRM